MPVPSPVADRVRPLPTVPIALTLLFAAGLLSVADSNPPQRDPLGWLLAVSLVVLVDACWWLDVIEIVDGAAHRRLLRWREPLQLNRLAEASCSHVGEITRMRLGDDRGGQLVFSSLWWGTRRVLRRVLGRYSAEAAEIRVRMDAPCQARFVQALAATRR